MPYPSREQATTLAKKYLTDTYNHCFQVATVMEHFANKLGQDSEKWFIIGLLHDVDRDHIDKDASKHLGDEFENIIGELFVDDSKNQVIEDIRSHYHIRNVPVDTLIRQYLISIDELSGLLFAYSRMRGGFEGMERKGINKKIKDKTFAAGVDREHVVNCEKYLNIPLEEFAMEVVEGMKKAI